MSNKSAAAHHAPPKKTRSLAKHVSVADPRVIPGDAVDLVKWERDRHGDWSALLVQGRFVRRTRHFYTLELRSGFSARYPRSEWTLTIR